MDPLGTRIILPRDVRNLPRKILCQRRGCVYNCLHHDEPGPVAANAKTHLVWIGSRSHAPTAPQIWRAVFVWMRLIKFGQL
jgi:hypothetical protein